MHILLYASNRKRDSREGKDEETRARGQMFTVYNMIYKKSINAFSPGVWVGLRRSSPLKAPRTLK